MSEYLTIFAYCPKILNIFKVFLITGVEAEGGNYSFVILHTHQHHLQVSEDQTMKNWEKLLFPFVRVILQTFD